MAVKIITISRQFGSGGRTLGKLLAKDLGFEYYDREIIDRVAGETGFSRDYVAANGEYAPGNSIISYSFEAAGTPGRDALRFPREICRSKRKPWKINESRVNNLVVCIE